MAEGIHERVSKKVGGVTLLLDRSLEIQLGVAAMQEQLLDLGNQKRRVMEGVDLDNQKRRVTEGPHKRPDCF